MKIQTHEKKTLALNVCTLMNIQKLNIILQQIQAIQRLVTPQFSSQISNNHIHICLVLFKWHLYN
jgi:hypothetical protein